MKKNNTIEEINTSINNLLEEWNISDEHNMKIVTHVIGLQLKKIRLIKDLTQTKVAKAINVTFQQIQKYEKGSNLPNPIRLLALSQFFSVDIDYWVKPILNTDLSLLSMDIVKKMKHHMEMQQKRRENGYALKQDFVAR